MKNQEINELSKNANQTISPDNQINSYIQMKKLYFTLKFFNTISYIIKFIISDSYHKIQNQIHNKSTEQTDNKHYLFKIFKNKSFLLKNLILFMNINWREENQNNMLINESYFKLLTSSFFNLHDFCLFHLLFKYAKEVLSNVIDCINLDCLSSLTILNNYLVAICDTTISKMVDVFNETEKIFHNFECICIGEKELMSLNSKKRNEDFINILYLEGE